MSGWEKNAGLSQADRHDVPGKRVDSLGISPSDFEGCGEGRFPSGNETL